MGNNTKKFWVTMFFVILAGTASWAFYGLVYKGSDDGLTKISSLAPCIFGKCFSLAFLNNTYAKHITVILVVFAIFSLSGYGWRKSIKNILK